MITLLKQPAQFFNATNPAIFEFTTDSVVGNFDDYVCDVVIRSLWADKTAIIRNVFPNTKTKIFSVDASEFFKALQLQGFDFDFSGTKNFGVEKFETSLKIRDSSVPADDVFHFDMYIFDNFVFTDGVGTVDTLDVDLYSILGERILFDSFSNPLVTDKLTFLAPDYIEVHKGFSNYVPVFVNELIANSLTVGGVSGVIPNVKGVSHYLLTDAQLDKIGSMMKITTTNQNPAKQLFALPFNDSGPCTPVVQFRFPNIKGGFSFFYAEIDAESEDRTKITFYDRAYSNENENRSPAVQSGGEYKNELTFKGIKSAYLKDLFSMMLRAPKIEMNMKQINANDVFVECEVTGSKADRYSHYDYVLKAKITNSGNFTL